MKYILRNKEANKSRSGLYDDMACMLITHISRIIKCFSENYCSINNKRKQTLKR